MVCFVFDREIYCFNQKKNSSTARTYQSNANEKDREKIELLRIKD
jgi:hypothetical protein